MKDQYTKQQVMQIVKDSAQAHGIPPDDFLRFAAIETGFKFDENAHNHGSGAKGLFQFVPATAKAYGIAGREFDPTVNAAAAAQLYQDNKKSLEHSHAKTLHPYLSGATQPNGLDLYLAHQQGAAGYASISVAALAGGAFYLGTSNSVTKDRPCEQGCWPWP